MKFLKTEKEWSNLRKILHICIFFAVFLYVFAIFSLAARPFFNYVTIGIAGLMCLLILIYCLLYTGIKIDRFSAILVLFVAFVFLSTVINGKIASLRTSVILMAAIGWILYQFARGKDNLEPLFATILVSGLCFYAYYIIHYRSEILSSSVFSFSARLGNYFDNENGCARDFVILGVISLHFAIYYKRYYVLLYTLLSLFLLMTTGSISNLSCFLIVFFVYLFLFLTGKKRIYLSVGLIIAIAGIIVLLQLPEFEYFKNRIERIFLALFTDANSGVDGSAAGRLEFALDALKIFFQYPLFGVGPGGVISYSSGGYSHNNFCELLCNYGIFSTVIFQILIITPAFFSKSRGKGFDALIKSLVCYIFIFQAFLVTYYTKIDYVIFALCFGAVSGEFREAITIYVRSDQNNHRTIVIKKEKNDAVTMII